METLLASSLFHIYAALFGAIIGSFLNVFLYRFHTGRSLNGSSHCLSCQERLRWFELVPVFSYFALRGRCRHCGSWIPSRYAVVELLVAGSFLLASYVNASVSVQLVTALFLTVLVAICVYDFYHTIIPDAFTIVLVVLATLHLLVAAPLSTTGLLGGLLAGVAAAGPFLFLWVISQGRWIGLGDSKLAFPLGMWIGLSGVVSLILLSFWVGALLSVSMLAIQRLLQRGKIDLRLFGRPLTMKSEIPFAPFLIIAFVLVAFCSVDALALITYALW